MMSLSSVAAVLQARHTGEAAIAAVGTDSRAITPGQLFVALRGARFDGHDFVAQAARDGAAAALVDARWADAQENPPPLPLLVVEDTRLALGALAAHWRSHFLLPLVGVTGSNGKTSVKEMCAAILRAQAELDGMDPADAVLATQGNLNNDIGLPLMLLRLRGHHRAAVIEMGMNHPGEIAYLTQLAKPTVAIVTNAQRAHLQGMGGLLEIAREKGAIYEGLGHAGVAVVNGDDAFADFWREQNALRRVVSFGLEQQAEVHGAFTLRGLGARVDLTSPAGAVSFELRVPGLHNVRNAVGAAAACLAAGAGLEAVARGLTNYRGTRGRLQRRDAQDGATLLDDTYNANPDSVRAGIDVLASTPGRKILVLGDMGEIGQTSAQLHDEVGGYAKSQGIDQLLALGAMSEVAAKNFGDGGQHFAKIEDLIAALRKGLDASTVVLVKGSRFMRMERVADAIALPLDAATPNPGHH
ncbi:MAG: UDP-N-acetylmuramoyl-tripeptide--D-alanyl-D-alanine ligase [Rhodocyclaceae bacterium]|jgi:UDP-N-acetylmuramoyl-tripeptide--D-alanyl-D-alanine ligase|nr:UDP-N-acetylmuramoyl-tripeptide--D-alanyl-D-alanine ligase [Rhodocyclaceae bacterium]